MRSLSELAIRKQWFLLKCEISASISINCKEDIILSMAMGCLMIMFLNS